MVRGTPTCYDRSGSGSVCLYKLDLKTSVAYHDVYYQT